VRESTTPPARPLYERALRIGEEALGPTHPLVAQILANFALLLQTTGDSAGARSLYERARLADLALNRAQAEMDDEALRGHVFALEGGETTRLKGVNGRPSSATETARNLHEARDARGRHRRGCHGRLHL
jgi:hypothetical protein